ncbi:capsule assembly Wzi family protein [Hahella sp. KA22]|uniref:capsule assembly Wzi family protein n=1 Tax=Hahella sp. KA22 TaxID=1628392 RepID=UPI000FDCF012|nr:capsule assembly Wzi family protein [Hahella sp. KA22]AZZ91655.1 capsule assembly Wzi family protein [Hahella sp. KA22]QAY55025.1 capsule assembly Wzi family protein [Hahella sp. KA22]
MKESLNPGRRSVLALLLVWSLNAHGSPWADSDDIRLRHSLQLLVDSGYANLNVMAWPISWSSIDRELMLIDRAELPSDRIRTAFDYVQFELRRYKTQTAHFDAGFRVSNRSPLLKQFGDGYTENQEVWGRADFLGSWWALNLRVSAVNGDYDDLPTARADGSYIAGLIGNWVVGAGAIERWWGPGWRSSLILSSNARPVPGIFIRRNSDSEFETPWLSWLGPWSLEMFGGQLEGDRYVPDAKLLGARFSFRPLQRLELALYRTAQWGGDGRPQSFSSLIDLFLGRDNVGDGGITRDNEPGNQLGGVDLRFSFNLGSLPSAFYAQMVGEDEAGGVPSKRNWLGGLESSFGVSDWDVGVFLEAADTTAGGALGDPFFNVTYNHQIYQTGYRYRGRAIGAAFDNDSEIYSLGMRFISPDSAMIKGAVSRLRANVDGIRTANPPSGELYTASVWAVEMAYQNEWRALRYELGCNYYSAELINDYASSGDFQFWLEGTYRF